MGNGTCHNSSGRDARTGEPDAVGERLNQQRSLTRRQKCIWCPFSEMVEGDWPILLIRNDDPEVLSLEYRHMYGQDVRATHSM